MLWHAFHLLVSAGFLYWFRRHSVSREILYGFSSCHPKWSIVISIRKAKRWKGMENSHHFHHHVYTWPLFCTPQRPKAVLWFHPGLIDPWRSASASPGVMCVCPRDHVSSWRSLGRNEIIKWQQSVRETRGIHNDTLLTAAYREPKCGRCCWLLPTLEPLQTSDYANSGGLFSAQSVHNSPPFFNMKM